MAWLRVLRQAETKVAFQRAKAFSRTMTASAANLCVRGHGGPIANARARRQW